jgi:hypothetical protein
VSLTEAQFAELRRLAEAENVTPARLLVERAFGAPAVNNKVVATELMGLRRLLVNDSTNINQAARAANSGSFHPEVWEELRGAVKARNEALADRYGLDLK